MEATARLLGPLERALYLKTVPPLRELSPKELSLVAQYVNERQFWAGDRLHRSDERVNELLVVVEGRVTVSGGEYGKGTIDPSEAVGLLSLLAKSDEGLDACAEIDTLALEIRAEDLENVFEDHFDILLSQIRHLARQILEKRMEVPDGAYLASRRGPRPNTRAGVGLIDRLIYLRQGDSFNRINLDALVEMAVRLRETRFEAGTRIWRQGDPSHFAYILVEGTVRGTREGGEREFRAGPGYPLGNLESICQIPRWYEAVTETAVVALEADTDVFLDVLEDHYAMAMDYVSGLAKTVLNLRKEELTAAKDGTALS